MVIGMNTMIGFVQICSMLYICTPYCILHYLQLVFIFILGAV